MQGLILVANGKLDRFKVGVSVFREGGQYVADCMMLGLASHGKSAREARTSLQNVIEVFLEEVIEMGTLDQVLRKHGWTRRSGHGRGPARQEAWEPPKVISAVLAHAAA